MRSFQGQVACGRPWLGAGQISELIACHVAYATLTLISVADTSSCYSLTHSLYVQGVRLCRSCQVEWEDRIRKWLYPDHCIIAVYVGGANATVPRKELLGECQSSWLSALSLGLGHTIRRSGFWTDVEQSDHGVFTGYSKHLPQVSYPI